MASDAWIICQVNQVKQLLHEAIQYVVCFLTRIGQFRCVAVQLHLLNLHKKKRNHIFQQYSWLNWIYFSRYVSGFCSNVLHLMENVISAKKEVSNLNRRWGLLNVIPQYCRPFISFCFWDEIAREWLKANCFFTLGWWFNQFPTSVISG